MASDPDHEMAGRGVAVARREIRVAEASRILQLPLTTDLSASACRWLSDGIETANMRALAGAGTDVPDGVRVALLEHLAAELGLSFGSTGAARRLHAEEIIRSMRAGEDVGGRLHSLANGFTDELTTAVRNLLVRLGRRSRA
jgi:hypothetical protein